MMCVVASSTTKRGEVEEKVFVFLIPCRPFLFCLSFSVLFRIYLSALLFSSPMCAVIPSATPKSYTQFPNTTTPSAAAIQCDDA